MNENEKDLVERTPREAMERRQPDPEPQRGQVDEMHRQAIEALRNRALVAIEPPTLHYTALPEATADSPLYHEWNTYRREVTRLMAEGHEGRWTLIAARDIIGLWDTQEEANWVAAQRFPGRAVLIKQILRFEPMVRCTRLLYAGFLNKCRS
jgi:hypothetical protein